MSQTSSTLREASARYLDAVKRGRELNTYKAYAQGVAKFLAVVSARGIHLDKATPATIEVEWFEWFLNAVQDYAASTEAVWITSVRRFYEFLAAEEGASINMDQLRSKLWQRQRKVALTVPDFPEKEIEYVVEYAAERATELPPDNSEAEEQSGRQKRLYLVRLRDYALLTTLCDTGLRVSEACRLTRGQLNFRRRIVIVRTKGGNESVVRFSERASEAIRFYLQQRQALDGASGKAISTLPVFARHNPATGQFAKPRSKKKTPPPPRLPTLKPVGVRKILDELVVSSFKARQKSVPYRDKHERRAITPHKFRHYFVTKILAKTGSLKKAQELARHSSITTTQRYAHLTDTELSQTYRDVFDD